MTSSLTHLVEGGCHCGTVRFRVRIPDPLEVLECTCSICTKTGFDHVIVPESDFELLAGQDALTSYRFNTGAAEHLFCKHCGVKSFYRPRSHPEGYSVNFRCLDEVPAHKIIRKVFDGANWEDNISKIRSQ